jgi:hypothetical protein
MELRRPLSWPTVALILVLSLATLGDTCPARRTAPAANAGAPAAEQPAAAETRYVEPLPTVETSVIEATPAAASVEPAAKSAADESAPPAATFDSSVRPILAVRCAPCHNPGGVMYERLPFDRPEVVSSHAAGVRRRLKDEDLKAFERWMAARGSGSAVQD